MLTSLAFGLAAVAIGCSGPQWRSDDYVVEGTLEGSTCRVRVDGHELTAADGPFGEEILIRRDPGMNRELPAGQGVNSLYCLGLQLMIVSPLGTFPPQGRYAAAGGPLSGDAGLVNMRVYFRRVREGRWPFALTGVHLEARDGYLELDEMTANTARGSFRAVMRRQPNGT